MFGKLGTWWDHRPLWQKIGLGVVGAVGAGLGAGALLGGGGAAAEGAGAAAAEGAGVSDAGAASALKGMIEPHGFRAMLARHPGMLKYSKIAAGQGVNMYQDMAAKQEAERQRRQQLAMYLMQMQGPGMFPPSNGGLGGEQ